jgi:hypothetical protein
MELYNGVVRAFSYTIFLYLTRMGQMSVEHTNEIITENALVET